MRAHGDSSASSVMDTFAEASDSSQANLNGGSSHRAALVLCPVITLCLHKRHLFRLRRDVDGEWATQGGAEIER